MGWQGFILIYTNKHIYGTHSRMLISCWYSVLMALAPFFSSHTKRLHSISPWVMPIKVRFFSHSLFLRYLLDLFVLVVVFLGSYALQSHCFIHDKKAVTFDCNGGCHVLARRPLSTPRSIGFRLETLRFAPTIHCCQSSRLFRNSPSNSPCYFHRIVRNSSSRGGALLDITIQEYFSTRIYTLTVPRVVKPPPAHPHSLRDPFLSSICFLISCYFVAYK